MALGSSWHVLQVNRGTGEVTVQQFCLHAVVQVKKKTNLDWRHLTILGLFRAILQNKIALPSKIVRTVCQIICNGTVLTTNQLWAASRVPIFPNLFWKISPDVPSGDATQPENRIHELKVFIFARFSLPIFVPFCFGEWLVCPALSRCRTIALETGFQNSQLCSTIVQLSFSPEELEIMFAFPLIYSIFQLVVAVILVGGESLMSGSRCWLVTHYTVWSRFTPWNDRVVSVGLFYWLYWWSQTPQSVS